MPYVDDIAFITRELNHYVKGLIFNLVAAIARWAFDFTMPLAMITGFL